MSKSEQPVVIPEVLPPVRQPGRWSRHLPARTAVQWLKQGWRDLCIDPGPSLAYGTLVFLASLAIVSGLFLFGADYILFPALAGFMVVGPIVAIGLYEKSRRITAGERISLLRMIFVRPQSVVQICSRAYCFVCSCCFGCAPR